MKTIILAIAALGFVSMTSFANAGGCPIGTLYSCVPYGGKMMCGCH